MYGMIHRCLRDVAIERLGETGWAEITAKLNIGPAEMISLNLYSDELTVSLIGCLADQLGLDFPEMLRQFGQAWVRFAQRGSFAAIMDFTGRSLGEFIANLDRMHQAVVVAMPQARVPSFVLVEESAGHLLVDYRSERAGLESFVIGLFEGLLNHYQQAGSVHLLGHDAGAARFEIRLAEAA